jgi:uncharacterized protein (DUF1810 family)
MGTEGLSVPRLDRFRKAQDQPIDGFESALHEIRTGGKRGHWIWYIFPQLSGLGTSPNSRYYAIEGLAEASEFLHDPTLRSRLLTITTAVARSLKDARPSSLQRLMGSAVDSGKLVSSLTLFAHVAGRLHAAEGLDEYATFVNVADQVLAAAASAGLPPCAYTLRQLSE